MDKRPKRRKSKDNPYELISYTDKNSKEYIVAFEDSNGEYRKIKVSKRIFIEFNQFELDDLKEMNEYDRHVEHSILYEGTVMNRLLNKVLSVEEQVEVNNRNKKLQETIARIEGCSQQAISKSITSSLKKIKKFLKNGL